MNSLFFQQPHQQVLLNYMEDTFIGPDASADRTLLLPAAARSQAHHAPVVSSQVYVQSDLQEQIEAAQGLLFQMDPQSAGADAVLNMKSFIEAGAAVTVPTDMQKNNQEQIAALVNSRERDVNELQATLAVPLASFNAKFIWHCIMNIEHDCEPAFIEKIKTIHRTFYLPPAIAFYTLWLHFRFWAQMPQVYYMVEALLPPVTASTAPLSKSARVGIILYMLAASFANKHLDDFSYRNSSWYEAARMPAKDFLQIELLALKELDWSLEISPKEWSNWLHHICTSNITLERTRPTPQNFHFVMARLIQDALVAIGEKDELLMVSVQNYTGRKGEERIHIVDGIKRPLWNDNSPTLVASSQGASPPTTDGLHARVNGNIADGPYGLHALQRKLQCVLDAGIPAPKYIPWDTSLDPVVHVHSRSRSSSGSGPRLGGEMNGFETSNQNPSPGFSLPIPTVGNLYNGDVANGHNRMPSYGHRSRHVDNYGHFGEVRKVAIGPVAGKHIPIAAGGGGPVTCEDILAGRRGSQFTTDYLGTKGMTMRPLKTCNIADVGFTGHHNVIPVYSTWQSCL